MSSVVELKPPADRQAVARTGAQAGAPRTRNLSRAQKAAVVIAILGEAEARPIVERLDDDTMMQVAEALETISTLSRQELEEIAVDFLKELRAASGSFSGGQDKAREIIANILDQNRYDQIYGSGETQELTVESAGDTWTRLEQYDAEQVAAYFKTLTPNIIALILRKLDVAAASEIVGFLEDDQLDPVIGHLVEDEAPDPDIYSVLAHMVEIELLNNTAAGPGGAAEDTAHLEVIGEMLSLVPSDKRDRILSFLNTKHETKLKSIERVMFTIGSLPDILPREAVAVVFRELGEDTMTQLLASLREGGAEVSDYLLGNISSRLADQYRIQLEDVASMSAEKAEKTQRQFLMALMALKREGTIKVGKPEEE